MIVVDVAVVAFAAPVVAVVVAHVKIDLRFKFMSEKRIEIIMECSNSRSFFFFYNYYFISSIDETFVSVL